MSIYCCWNHLNLNTRSGIRENNLDILYCWLWDKSIITDSKEKTNGDNLTHVNTMLVCAWHYKMLSPPQLTSNWASQGRNIAHKWDTWSMWINHSNLVSSRDPQDSCSTGIDLLVCMMWANPSFFPSYTSLLKSSRRGDSSAEPCVGNCPLKSIWHLHIPPYESNNIYHNLCILIQY